MTFWTIPLTTILAAADGSGALRSLDYDWPQSGWEWLLYGGGFVLVILFAASVYFRDTASLSGFWKVWLTTLRLGVLAALAVIALNPHERTQQMAWRPSRVAVLVDTSLSMGFPEGLPQPKTSAGTPEDSRTRAEAVKALLAGSSLLKTLQAQHEISFYTFDSALSGKHAVVLPLDSRSVAARAEAARRSGGTAGDADGDEAGIASLDWSHIDWDELLRPRGIETRIGEPVRKAIDDLAGSNFSGVVVVTDGAENAGMQFTAANTAARQAKVPIIAVGVGSTEKQVNLQLAGLQAPTDVHVNDPYEVTAFVQGQGLAGRTVEVELLTRAEDETEARANVVETREITLHEDGAPVEVKFRRDPTLAGSFRYLVRTRTTGNVLEADLSDNQDEMTINVIDRKTRVLLLAGGPMRDYIFVRNMLYRHSAVEVDVLLQSVDPTTAGRVSQDADNLLLEFPATPAELFEYDVIIAFDPDWQRIPAEGRELLKEWVDKHAGGLVLVAGDVFTGELAGGTDDLRPILDLYPVYLQSTLFDFGGRRDATQPWPVAMTDEGREAGFLQLLDDKSASDELWKSFGGMYRTYPTAGVKGGTTVFAHFADPRSQTQHGPPVLLASQFYGSGRALYLGSGETWRLRALSDEYYDRFWTKTIREVGQGRLKRGARRAMLMPERDRYYLGQTIRVRARLLDAQFQPMDVEAVTLDVYDPNGRPMSPPRQLVRDRNRPGEYAGDFRASLPGRYRMELQVPQSNEAETREVSVRVPNLEADSPEQNAALLADLVRDTGGKYLPLDEAEKAIPALLPNRGEEFLIDERLRTLWDRMWVMFVLVGLLSAEWLTRKLLKLA